MKNFACDLLFACGTPMMLGGDEFGRSQRGNNNAYCQDNEISWLDWDLASRNDDLVEFFRKAIAFTRRFPVLQRRKFLLGKDLDADGIPDLTWFAPDGGTPAWGDANARTLCYQLDASEDGVQWRPSGCFSSSTAITSRSGWTCRRSTLRGWYRAIDTSLPGAEDFTDAGQEVRLDPADHYIANARSTVVLLAR